MTTTTDATTLRHSFELTRTDHMDPREWTHYATGGLILIKRQSQTYELLLPASLARMLNPLRLLTGITAQQALHPLLALSRYWDQSPENALTLGPHVKHGIDELIAHLKRILQANDSA